MAFLHLRESRPNKHTHRVLWNDSWEKDLEIYESFRRHPPNLTFHRAAEIRAFESRIETYTLKAQERARVDITQLQVDLRRRAIDRLATDDLEEKWTVLRPDQRKEHILEALYKTSTAGPDLENCRKWCPDMTVENLGQDPHSYINLLMFLINSDTDVQGEPQLVLFPHPIVDQIFDSLSSIQGVFYTLKMRMDRSFFITMVLWRTYLSFHSLDEIYRFETPYSSNKKDTKKLFRDAVLHVSGSFPSDERKKKKEEYLEALHNFKQADKARGETSSCWACGKSESILPSNVQLRACAGCKKIERKVLYCSRECQKEDWTNGTPQPHKHYCGKPFSSSAKPTPSVERVESMATKVEKVPLPDSSFKRSPALLYQISFLRKDSNLDYTLVQKGNDPDISIVMPDIRCRCLFIAARTRALRCGDPLAVNLMYRLLRPGATSHAPSHDLKGQLKAEYGVAVVDGGTDDEKWIPSQAEMREAAEILLSFDDI